MMISQAAEYSLRAVLVLARSGGKPMTSQELSRRAGLPREYFAKVLQTLAKSGLVLGQRGLGGGFLLNRPAEDVTLWDVIAAVDSSRKVTPCPAQDAGVQAVGLCPLHRRLDAAVAAGEHVLRSSTIADLLREAEQPIHCQQGTPSCQPS